MKQQGTNQKDLQNAMKVLIDLASNASVFQNLAENMINSLSPEDKVKVDKAVNTKDISKAMKNLNGALNKMQDYGRKNK
tara:strand:+ start:749 stop:985 length:237 start_codon:yes stop_codon:yes gene_type:complete